MKFVEKNFKIKVYVLILTPDVLDRFVLLTSTEFDAHTPKMEINSTILIVSPFPIFMKH